jgi:hypothetical protein
MEKMAEVPDNPEFVAKIDDAINDALETDAVLVPATDVEVTPVCTTIHVDLSEGD